MIACLIVLSISAFFVFFAMVGYPVALFAIDKINKPTSIRKDYSLEPTVTYMIVAHNEEKCIKEKLDNILSFEYPLEKIQVLIASDFCTDNTDIIVQKFIYEHPEINIVLHQSKEHKGKTNAQNETQKLATGEILIMTDANAIFDKAAIRELVSSFGSDDVWYVCGQLKYTNDYSDTGKSESFYWELELKQREIESNTQTITAGNGSIYAIRNNMYLDLKPVYCHDDRFPFLFALKKKKCLYNRDAVAYEKAGETNQDEFKRKVRMNRSILNIFVDMWRPLNVIKYHWFSLFYFGHRTCRYLLWFNHLLFFAASLTMIILGQYIVGGIFVGLQLLCLLLGILSIKHGFRNFFLRIVGYYSMTVLAQFIAAIKQMTGKSKPVWEKAESTR